MTHALQVLVAVVFLVPGVSQAGDFYARDDPRLQRVHGQMFVDGVALHGDVVSRHGDGRMKSRTPYHDGLRSGQSEAWWPDGALRYQRRYRADLLQGESLEWYADGQLRYRQQFETGQEQGLQEGWHEGGREAFAYAIDHGRRFGVLGSKPCFTTSAEALGQFNEN